MRTTSDYSLTPQGRQAGESLGFPQTELNVLNNIATGITTIHDGNVVSVVIAIASFLSNPFIREQYPLTLEAIPDPGLLTTTNQDLTKAVRNLVLTLNDYLRPSSFTERAMKQLNDAWFTKEPPKTTTPGAKPPQTPTFTPPQNPLLTIFSKPIPSNEPVVVNLGNKNIKIPPDAKAIIFVSYNKDVPLSKESIPVDRKNVKKFETDLNTQLRQLAKNNVGDKIFLSIAGKDWKKHNFAGWSRDEVAELAEVPPNQSPQTSPQEAIEIEQEEPPAIITLYRQDPEATIRWYAKGAVPNYPPQLLKKQKLEELHPFQQQLIASLVKTLRGKSPETLSAQEVRELTQTTNQIWNSATKEARSKSIKLTKFDSLEKLRKTVEIPDAGGFSERNPLSSQNHSLRKNLQVGITTPEEYQKLYSDESINISTTQSLIIFIQKLGHELGHALDDYLLDKAPDEAFQSLSSLEKYTNTIYLETEARQKYFNARLYLALGYKDLAQDYFQIAYGLAGYNNYQQKAAEEIRRLTTP